VGVAYGVDGVELPGRLQVIEAERVDVLVDSQRNLDEEVHDHETLGTNLEWQDFDSVCDQETRPSQSIGDAEKPDHGNDGLAGGLATLGFLLRRANRPNNEADAHRCSSSKEERSSSDAVDKQSAGHGDDERENREATVDAELGVRVGYTDGVVDVGGVVGDETVAGPLGEETERAEEQEPVPVALGLEEVEVRRRLLVLEFQTEGLLDLGILELHCRVVDVAIRVVLAEDVECLFVALLCDQPTWRLGDPEDEDELDDGGERLSKGRNAPRPIGIDTLGAKSQPGADNGTHIPETVVDGSDTASVLRVANLSKQERRGELGKRVSETHEESTGHEIVEVLSTGLDTGSNNHDHTSNGNGGLTSEMIGDVRSDWERSNGSD
jgi:hypothetical protein